MKYFFVIKDEYCNEVTRIGTKLLRGIYNEAHLNEIIQNNKIQHYRKLPPFKEGSKVKLVNFRPEGWNPFGGMDQYQNQIVEIQSIDTAYFRIIGGGMWHFRPSDIVEVIKF